MLSVLRWRLGLGLKLGAAALAAGASGLLVLPGEAQACSPKECSGLGGFSEFSLTHTTAPNGGVLVFRTQRWSSDFVSDEETLEHITVVVTDAQGSEFEGAVELSGPVFLWRPTMGGLGAGELTVSVSIDNAAIQEGGGPGCEFEDVQLSVMIEGQVLDFDQLDQLEPSFLTDYVYVPSTDMTTYVCCDGAYPAEDFGGCGGEPPYYDEGYCVAARGTAFADAHFELPVPPALSQFVRVELVADGVVVGSSLGVDFAKSGISGRLDHAFDAQLRIVSLLSGSQYMSGPFVADGGQPDALGEIEATISAELEENCETPAYTCDSYPPDSPAPSGWDPEACEPIDDASGETDGPSDGGSGSETDGDSVTGGESDGDTESPDTDADDADAGDADGDDAGCGCTAGGDAPFRGGLLVLAIAGILRRRRHTRASTRPLRDSVRP